MLARFVTRRQITTPLVPEERTREPFLFRHEQLEVGAQHRVLLPYDLRRDERATVIRSVGRARLSDLELDVVHDPRQADRDHVNVL